MSHQDIDEKTQCLSLTKANMRCSRTATIGTNFCFQHSQNTSLQIQNSDNIKHLEELIKNGFKTSNDWFSKNIKDNPTGIYFELSIQGLNELLDIIYPIYMELITDKISWIDTNLSLDIAPESLFKYLQAKTENFTLNSTADIITDVILTLLFTQIFGTYITLKSFENSPNYFVIGREKYSENIIDASIVASSIRGLIHPDMMENIKYRKFCSKIFAEYYKKIKMFFTDYDTNKFKNDNKLDKEFSRLYEKYNIIFSSITKGALSYYLINTWLKYRDNEAIIFFYKNIIDYIEDFLNLYKDEIIKRKDDWKALANFLSDIDLIGDKINKYLEKVYKKLDEQNIPNQISKYVIGGYM